MIRYRSSHLHVGGAAPGSATINSLKRTDPRALATDGGAVGNCSLSGRPACAAAATGATGASAAAACAASGAAASGAASAAAATGSGFGTPSAKLEMTLRQASHCANALSFRPLIGSPSQQELDSSATPA